MATGDPVAQPKNASPTPVGKKSGPGGRCATERSGLTFTSACSRARWVSGIEGNRQDAKARPVGTYDDAGAEHERLGALVGRWKTEGSITAAVRDGASRIEATDTYEWLPGGRALLHRVHALVGDEELEGAEIIGYDLARRTYVAQYFGTDGSGTYEASLANEYGALVLKMRSRTARFTGMFSDDGNTIEGHWELLDADSHWQPRMDVTLIKEPDQNMRIEKRTPWRP